MGKRNYLPAMLVMVLAFGMAVVGCDNGNGGYVFTPVPPVDLGPYPNEIEISYDFGDISNTWEGDSLTAVLTITFSPVTRPPLGTTGVFSGSPVSITPADLAWFQAGSVGLQYTDFVLGSSRSVSVTSVGRRQSGNNVEVLLTLTRSAVPPPATPGFHTFVTADFDVTFPPEFEDRFEEIRWRAGRRFFLF